MRSIRMLAALTGTLTLASACGGDGGTPPTDNTAPVAVFTEVCTQLSCVFTDASTDADGTIASWSWNFGDGSTAAVQAPPAHVYATAGAKTVTLTVTDNEGATNTATKTVTVTAPPPQNVAPVANFDLPTGCTAGTPCGFHSTSTDANGNETIVSASWEFGAPDLGTEEGTDVTHTFSAGGTYDVKLTVTDNGAPALTGEITKQLVVAPAAVQDCTTTGTFVDCSLTMTARVTVTFTMSSRACELSGNKISASATGANPNPQQVFGNLCSRPVGQQYTVLSAPGVPLVLESGAVLAIKFEQGTPDPIDPPIGDPGIQVTGSAPTWTLNIDDGGAAGTLGEPDFDDAVITVQATAAP